MSAKRIQKAPKWNQHKNYVVKSSQCGRWTTRTKHLYFVCTNILTQVAIYKTAEKKTTKKVKDKKWKKRWIKHAKYDEQQKHAAACACPSRNSINVKREVNWKHNRSTKQDALTKYVHWTAFFFFHFDLIFWIFTFYINFQKINPFLTLKYWILVVQTTFIRFLRVFFTLENLFLNTFKSIGKKSNFPPIHTLNKFSFNLFSSRSSSLTLRKTKKKSFLFCFWVI